MRTIACPTLGPPFSQVDSAIDHFIAPCSYRQGRFVEISKSEPFDLAQLETWDSVPWESVVLQAGQTILFDFLCLSC
jgi:hypothetical protein